MKKKVLCIIICFFAIRISPPILCGDKQQPRKKTHSKSELITLTTLKTHLFPFSHSSFYTQSKFFHAVQHALRTRLVVVDLKDDCFLHFSRIASNMHIIVAYHKKAEQLTQMHVLLFSSLYLAKQLPVDHACLIGTTLPEHDKEQEQENINFLKKIASNFKQSEYQISSLCDTKKRGSLKKIGFNTPNQHYVRELFRQQRDNLTTQYNSTSLGNPYSDSASYEFEFPSSWETDI